MSSLCVEVGSWMRVSYSGAGRGVTSWPAPSKRLSWRRLFNKREVEPEGEQGHDLQKLFAVRMGKRAKPILRVSREESTGLGTDGLLVGPRYVGRHFTGLVLNVDWIWIT